MKFIDTHTDAWHTVVGEDGPSPHPIAKNHQLLTLEQWHAVRDHWSHDLIVGVIVPNTADIEALEADLPRLSLIVLHFPKWVDGRAYSQARLLRSRYAYQGEVRATGDVVVDMLPLLKRTGFDAVQLRPGQSREIAESTLAAFGGHYQADVTQHQPVFNRPADQAWVAPAADLNAGAAI